MLGDAGGDPITSLIQALADHLDGDAVAEVLIAGLKSYLDLTHPMARARRIAEYQRPTGKPLPREVLYPPANYTVAEVAERLNVSRWWVVRRIQEGRIASFRLGREYRITQATLDALLKDGAE